MSLSIYKDKAGDAGLGFLLVNLGFNAVVKTGQFTKFSAGLGGGVNYRTINPSKLQWESQYNGFTYDASWLLAKQFLKALFYKPILLED